MKALMQIRKKKKEKKLTRGRLCGHMLVGPDLPMALTAVIATK